MEEKTMEQVLRILLENPFDILDITGGAPELNPSFRMLVAEANKGGRHVIVRTNLTVLFEEGKQDLPDFYHTQNVELIASLPYYLENGVDRVRGSGTFRKSIDALQLLNRLGYGKESSGLLLSLVYNPQGLYLAPNQSMLESDYKRELKSRFGISFTHLYTFANMPIGRFREFLTRTGNLAMYLDKLSTAFNPMTLDGLMCRHLVSIGWNGALYDCDFNQALGIRTTFDTPHHVTDFDYYRLVRRTIAVDDHCYGCTAGQGST